MHGKVAEEGIIGSELCGEQPGQVRTDLADLRIRAGHAYAVAVRRTRRAAHEVIALVHRDDEERIRLVDAGLGQAVEESLEGRIVGSKLRDVSSLPGGITKAFGPGEVVVVGVGNVRI